MAAQDLAYQVRGMTSPTTAELEGTGVGGGGDEGDPPGVEEGVEPDPSVLLASLASSSGSLAGLI